MVLLQGGVLAVAALQDDVPDAEGQLHHQPLPIRPRDDVVRPRLGHTGRGGLQMWGSKTGNYRGCGGPEGGSGPHHPLLQRIECTGVVWSSMFVCLGLLNILSGRLFGK